MEQPRAIQSGMMVARLSLIHDQCPSMMQGIQFLERWGHQGLEKEWMFFLDWSGKGHQWQKAKSKVFIDLFCFILFETRSSS